MDSDKLLNPVPRTSNSTSASIDFTEFYSVYHGHAVNHLERLHSFIRRQKDKGDVIFLAGDSSLDNKFWFDDRAAATNGYELIMDPPLAKQDIAHWLNTEIVSRNLGSKYTAINCAVEESSIGSRDCCLNPQDVFIRENISEQDILVVSVGGNDVALKPSICTIFHMLTLMCCTTNDCLKNSMCGTACPCDDPCQGCTTGCCSDCLACPPGYGYFIHLFGKRIQSYLERVTAKKRPKIIAICMIYFPDEQTTGSWADRTLSVLGYNSNPAKLQMLIAKIFQDATKLINVQGSRVVPVPLFEVLNGKTSADYSQRVEPSAIGGEKMGKLIMDYVTGVASSEDAAAGSAGGGGRTVAPMNRS